MKTVAKPAALRWTHIDGPRGSVRGDMIQSLKQNRYITYRALIVFVALASIPGSAFCWPGILCLMSRSQSAPASNSHFESARALYKTGNYRQSLSELEQSEKASERAALRLLYRAMDYGQLSEWQRVPPLLEAFVLEHPDNEEAWYWLGAGQFHTHHFVDAGKSIARALTLNPKDADAYRVQGLIDLELGLRNEAYQSWLTAARLNPSDSETAYLMGRLFFDSNHFTEASQWLNQSLAISPHHFRASYFLGLTEEALGHWVEAIKLYRQCVADSNNQNTPYPWAYGSLGRLLTRTGELEQAAIVLEEGSRVAPDAHVFTALGELQFQERKLNQAVISLQRAIALDPTLPDPHYTLGRVLTALHRSRQAQVEIETFQRLKSLADAHPVRSRISVNRSKSGNSFPKPREMPQSQ